MPERTLWGLPVSEDALRQPVASIPQVADPKSNAERQKRQLEAVVKQAEVLAQVWRMPEFRAYCEGEMKGAMTKLLTAEDVNEMKSLQALARAWSTLIKDFSAKEGHLRQLEVQLSDFRTDS